MKKLTTALTLAALCLFAAAAVQAAEVDMDYRLALKSYFNVNDDVIDQLLTSNISPEEMPVALFIHERAKVSIETLNLLRKQGDSWLEIASVRGIKPQDFYVIIVGNISSTTYAPIMAKFKSTPVAMWNRLDLSDQDIVNLVNLKFIASEHDYSIFKAMELRDSGQDFVRINHQVKVLKAEMIRAQKEKDKA